MTNAPRRGTTTGGPAARRGVPRGEPRPSAGETRMTAGRRSVRWLTFGIVVAGALAVLGFIAFWPRGDAPELAPQPNTYVDATVTGIDEQTCDDFDTGATTPCQIVSAELTSGPDDGDVMDFQVRRRQLGVPAPRYAAAVGLRGVPPRPAEFRYSW